MIAKLQRFPGTGLYHLINGEREAGPNPLLRGNYSLLRGNCSRLRGDCSGLEGDCSHLRGKCTGGLRGDCSGLWGDLSGLWGNLEDCEISDGERQAGIAIRELVAPAKERDTKENIAE